MVGATQGARGWRQICERSSLRRISGRLSEWRLRWPRTDARRATRSSPRISKSIYRRVCLTCLPGEPPQARIRTTKGSEMPHKEIKRRTRVARIFLHRKSCLRFVTALAVEPSAEWITGGATWSCESSNSTAIKSKERKRWCSCGVEDEALVEELQRHSDLTRHPGHATRTTSKEFGFSLIEYCISLRYMLCWPRERE
jgi:hypothetical protein